MTPIGVFIYEKATSKVQERLYEIGLLAEESPAGIGNTCDSDCQGLLDEI